MEIAVAIIALVAGILQITSFIMNRYKSSKDEPLSNSIDSLVAGVPDMDEEDLEVTVEGAISQIEDILE